jgi:hypothetical protein
MVLVNDTTSSRRPRMASISAALRHVNRNLSDLLPEQVIRAAAEAAGHRWRQRKLGPVQTVLLLVLQLLSGNGSLAEARALAGYSVCVAALAKARQRLPLELLARVNAWLLQQCALGVVAADPSAPPRVLLVDAANYYAPDAPELRRRYRRPRQKTRRGDYPQLRTLCVFDLHSGMLLAQHEFASDRHESPQLRHVLDRLDLRGGEVIVFDCGFVSYANLCLLLERGVQVVARLPSKLRARRGTRRTRLARLGRRDALVRWLRPERRPPGCPLTAGRWRALPPHLELRQLTVGVAPQPRARCRSVSVITTLLDPRAHPAGRIADWYRRRWEVETDLRHLKATLRLEFLRTRSVANVRRELWLRAIAYNLVRLAMLRAAESRGGGGGGGGVDPQRVSFADACRWLRLAQASGVPLARLLINPRRTRRPRPRKLKYRGKNYRLLTTRLAPQTRVA